MRRISMVLSTLVFALMSLSVHAEELDDGVKNEIAKTQAECRADPEKFLGAIVNPQMRAAMEGRRYPAFCTCFANTFVRLMDDWVTVSNGRVRKDPEYTKRLKVMSLQDVTLVTYRRCVKLVQEKIP